MTVPNRPFWSLHTHSRYSANDALPTVQAMVDRAVKLGYPALGLTDHGNISGAVQLYKACRKAGVEPVPGIELYLTPDREAKEQSNYHLTVAAYSTMGYRNLVHLNNQAQANFHYRPRLDLADLAHMAERGDTAGLLVSTGCHFGLVTQTLLKNGNQAARQIVNALAMWFPKVYVELHLHGVPKGYNGHRFTEMDIIEELIDIANAVGVPYILADDAHYTHDHHQPLHDGLKTMVSFSDDPSEAIFPGGPYSMHDRRHYEAILPKDIVDTACSNLWDLAQKASVRLPELESFIAKMPDVSTTGSPQSELEQLVLGKIEDPDRMVQAGDELAVIEKIDAAGYLLLVEWVCSFMRDKGIWFHTRGSASGSLVCYELGITQVDPIKAGLRFDRFMSPDRISMPDIDLDVEHERRDEVIAALEERFSVRQVGSHMQLGLTAEEDDEGTGSLMVKYFSAAKKRGEEVHAWADIPKEGQQLLRDLGALKLISGPGTHAAGYIVAPDEAAVAELPLTWMPGRGALVTAYGKKDVEALGFVKLDLLGLKTRTAIRIACESIWRDGNYLAEDWTYANAYDVWDQIPDKDADTFKRIGKGDTDGIFQLEGKAFTFGVRDMKPKSLADIIAAQALFRPASTKAGVHTRYMARRAKKEELPPLHADLLAETKETYGLPLYQEQVMGACRRLGMSSKELTQVLDALKASNDNVGAAQAYLDSITPRIEELAAARGWEANDIAWLVNALAAYGDYGFNKAHAASYGLVSWRTAYLATHHPLEWWHAMLVAFQGAKRGKQDLESHYVRATRAAGVRVAPAHVNKSGTTYTLDREANAVRKGLTSVKGVGRVAAAELALHAPYTSLSDLGERVTPRRVSGARGLALKKEPDECGGVIAALHDAGALDGLPSSQEN